MSQPCHFFAKTPSPISFNTKWQVVKWKRRQCFFMHECLRIWRYNQEDRKVKIAYETNAQPEKCPLILLTNQLQKCHWSNLFCYEQIEACVRYFSLFLKEKCIHSLFRTKKLTYSCFFFPSFHEHSLSLELPRAARILKTSCFEKRISCVIETMLMT